LFAAVSLGLFAQDTPEGTKVLISTSMGDIKVVLYDKTPLHRDNFVKLAKESYFDGTLFHRVINQFMIQGGDPDSRDAKPKKMLGNGGPDYTIPFEYVPEYFHKRGALAAARMGDDVNPEKASSGSQFYIVQGRTFSEEELTQIEGRLNKKFPTEQREIYKKTGGTPFLDGNYTVFGEVYEGMDVVDKIAQVTCDSNSRPLENISMTVTLITK
jgi:peptidyl-prolyl cis-trans isomerase B (cyclophilin B)